VGSVLRTLPTVEIAVYFYCYKTKGIPPPFYRNNKSLVISKLYIAVVSECPTNSKKQAKAVFFICF